MVKAPHETVHAISHMSAHKTEYPLISVILLAIMAGGAIAMGDIFWAHATVGVAKNLAPGIANFIGGFAFSAGLMMVVFFGGHLFTSSILSGVSFARKEVNIFNGVISYWTVVWIFNFVGGVMIAYLYYKSGLPMKYNEAILKHFAHLGAVKTHLTFTEAFIRGIFCNVFVCMAIWVAVATEDGAGKIWGIAFLIAAFVASGYEHCVANMFIISEGLLAKAHYLAQFGGDIQQAAAALHIPVEELETFNIKTFLLNNELPVTLGNIVGGLIFVGIVALYSYKKELDN
ncbi:formate/nitrite transporter family protein [Caminibacter mediatlanticus TB-2]|nr:formate/nitrite transporter family protein [Caminibacter mediatlanticus TB-2]